MIVLTMELDPWGKITIFPSDTEQSDKVEDILGMISKFNKEMNVSKMVDEPIDLITSFLSLQNNPLLKQ